MRGERGKVNPGVAVILAVAGICFLLLNSRGCFWWPDMGIGTGLSSWGFGFVGFWGVIQVVLAVWVGVDAQKRGSNGYLWGLLVFFTSIVGLIVYLLWTGNVMEKLSAEVQNSATRPATPAASTVVVDAVEVSDACPACGGDVESGFKVCPACGAGLRCPDCDKPMRKGWKICPWCATKLR